ncbi:hypothetical protein GQ53DRAFT_810205 [Thozetella sp. PMI_491]|nr:hypothetical protein GQ53DRAFT_810205 [Thozetella sp. PMI_491]
MKYLAPVLATASLVAAVTLQQYFPACSVDCLNTAIGAATTCKTDDGVCICVFDNYVSIVDSATNCVIQACGSDVAVKSVLPAAADFCSAVSSSAGIATSTGESSPATTSPGTATTTVGSNSASTTAHSSASNTGSAGAAGSTGSAPTTSSSTAAAPTGGPAGLVAMLAVGAALL